MNHREYQDHGGGRKHDERFSAGNSLNIVKKAALYFARKEFCRNAICQNADLSLLKDQLSFPVIVGLCLIVFSSVIGVPSFFVVALIAAKLRKPFLGVVGIPLIYGLSWLLLMLGLYLAVPAYAKTLGSWLTRIALEKILGDDIKKLVSLPAKDLPDDMINSADMKG